MLVAFSEYSVFITVSMSGWRNPRGRAGLGQGNVSTVYPLLPGRCTGAGLSLSIKTSPSLRRRRGWRLQQARACLFGSRVTSLHCHVTCHAVSRGAAVAHSQFTQTHCSVYGVICSGDLTASSGTWRPGLFQKEAIIAIMVS